MEWGEVRDNWRHFRSKVKAQWSQLTEEDLDYVDGCYDRLTEKLSERCGLHEKEGAGKAVDDWLQTMGHARLHDFGSTGG